MRNLKIKRSKNCFNFILFLNDQKPILSNILSFQMFLQLKRKQFEIYDCSLTYIYYTEKIKKNYKAKYVLFWNIRCIYLVIQKYLLYCLNNYQNKETFKFNK